jgi:hypothetical protein
MTYNDNEIGADNLRGCSEIPAGSDSLNADRRTDGGGAGIGDDACADVNAAAPAGLAIDLPASGHPDEISLGALTYRLAHSGNVSLNISQG